MSDPTPTKEKPAGFFRWAANFLSSQFFAKSAIILVGSLAVFAICEGGRLRAAIAHLRATGVQVQEVPVADVNRGA